MKGFITRTLAAVCCGGLLGALGGCCTYPDLVDVCYPQRYNYMARSEVLGLIAPQIQNGRILDQTIWNYYFEPGSDKLTPGGLDRLNYLARRRPKPDPAVFLQTAQDLTYDQAAPEKFAEQRADLDLRRAQAIQRYLTVATAGRHVEFQVCVHDPAEVGRSAVPMGIAIQRMYIGTQGFLWLTVASGGSAGGAGGSAQTGAGSGMGGGGMGGGVGGGAGGAGVATSSSAGGFGP